MSAREPIGVGTAIMSPKTVMVTPALAKVMASTTSFVVVTQTGQPGPCPMVIPASASILSRPNLTRVSWCVPQTCMKRSRRSISLSLARIFLAMASSRYLRSFIPAPPSMT